MFKNKITLITTLLVMTGCSCLAGTETKSAAMQRFETRNSVHELVTQFRYSPLNGLGFDENFSRRDPSNIIKVDGTYYVWYTKSESVKWPWNHADIWYATSPDGKNWTEIGPAVMRGAKGSFDDYSVYSCNILVADEKYYLAYQADTTVPPKTQALNVIGMSYAESPDGPWKKLKEPILLPSADAVIEGDPANTKSVKVVQNGSFDSRNVHDVSFVKFKGKYYMYYKGYAWTNETGAANHGPLDTMWGVAIAENPTGPYIKSPLNPVMNSGHETFVFPWKNGIAAMVDVAGKEARTMQFSEDGINFYPVAALENIPPAGGAYIPDQFADNGNGQGFTWGLGHVAKGVPRNFLVRFECDLKQDAKKKFSPRNARFFNTIWEVVLEPEKYGLPTKK